MKIPPLKKGSKIGIIAPAGRVFEKDLDFAKTWLKNQGWEIEIPNGLFTDFDFGYHYAGKDNHRLEITQWALDNPDLDAIWCARGGYGCVKIIDDLDFSSFIQNPKWLIGYSDITVLHNTLNNRGIPTLHAVTAKQLNTKYTAETYDTLLKVLKNEPLQYDLENNSLNRRGEAKGILMGGNLSMLYSQLGSTTTLEGENIILLLEDWCENWYHVDRMMAALKRSGLLGKVSGAVIGSFTKMDIEEENPNFNEPYDSTSNMVILEYLKPLNIPILFHFPSGHTGDNRALILGSEVCLKVGEERSSLQFL